MDKNKLFKYYPQDFGKLTVKVIHMDLDFDIYEDHTKVNSILHLKTLENIKSLELNAKDLEIISITCKQSKIEYKYDKESDKIIIKFNSAVNKGSKIEINSVTICKPTPNVLEGLYYDFTPTGCPKTQITQCQQWGFQRLTPCIDDMTAKCTYRTKITADSRYTSIITNGDVSSARKSIGNGRDTITYDNMITPMAPYLFFLGVGTYSVFTKEFEYLDGKKFSIELLAPLGSDKNVAEKTLLILEEAIMWLYVYTGKEMYTKQETRNKLWSLFKERQSLIQKGNNETRLKEVRNEGKILLKKIIPGYQYTGSVYREIGMQNSNFGGMENVGNTTITANRLMPFKDITDGSFAYMISVKLHEFYHNINGSEVTGFSPFEIWLNEAVTVYIELAYHAFLFKEGYARLESVLGMISPDGGTIMQDENPTSLPILPDGFNDPNDLITGVTYVKGPEFVKMIERIMGKEKFSVALDMYHKKYAHSNATTKDWIACMEKVAKRSFSNMANSWLKQRGFPIVDVKSSYNKKNKSMSIELTQNSFIKKACFEFPCTIGLVDIDGKDIAEMTVDMKKRKEKVMFKEVDDPYFISVNRGLTFFGKVNQKETRNQLFAKARKDSDMINRAIAFNKLIENEKIKIIQGKIDSADDDLMELIFEKISDIALVDEYGSLASAMFESVDDKRFAHMYSSLYNARKKIVTQVAARHKKELISLYEKYKQSKDLPYVEKQIYDMKMRSVKNTCLSYLAKLDTADVQAMIKKQFYEATASSDKITAFILYINSSAPDKMNLINEYMSVARQNPVSWELFLSAIGGNDSDDAIDLIKSIESAKTFDITQSNEQRALYGRFAYNKKKSLQTKEGLRFLTDTLKKLAKINEYTAVGMLSVFGFVDYMEEKYHEPIISALIEIKNALSVKDTPSMYNRIRMILKSSKKARKNYEKLKGKVSLN